MRGACITLFSVLPGLVAGEHAIESNIDCGSRLGINEALVKFSSENNYVLQGRNSYCYKCAWSDVATPGTCRYTAFTKFNGHLFKI